MPEGWPLQKDQPIAAEVFSIPSNLSILAFGREHTYIDRLESLGDECRPRNIFIRSELLDKTSPGVAVTAAVLIERRLAKYVVPECDLLDYNFEYTDV